MCFCLDRQSLQKASPIQFLDPTDLQETIREHFNQLHGQLQLRQLALTDQLLSAAQSQRTALRETVSHIQSQPVTSQ